MPDLTSAEEERLRAAFRVHLAFTPAAAADAVRALPLVAARDLLLVAELAQAAFVNACQIISSPPPETVPAETAPPAGPPAASSTPAETPTP